MSYPEAPFLSRTELPKEGPEDPAAGPVGERRYKRRQTGAF